MAAIATNFAASLATRLATRLAALGVRRPFATTGVAAALVGWLLLHAAGLESEVGYAAYFGPDDPQVERLAAFLDEFESGIHMLVVFGCRDTPRCEHIGEPWALGFLARLQASLDALPNVRRTRSALDTPIVVGPLETRTLAALDGSATLAPDWRELLGLGRQQQRFARTVLAPDARAAGVVVELQSLQSEPMRRTVRGVLALRPDFEAELGADLHLAGDPVWTVVSADDLDRDSRVLTALMLLTMLGLLAALFRDVWLTALPLVTVAATTAVVQGLAALLGVPLTSVLAALPPLLVVIAVAASIHLLTAFVRRVGAEGREALVSGAREVGAGCFWAAATTAAGFASFLGSDLQSVRDFGALAAAGLGASFALTFTLLPALLTLRLRVGRWRPAERRRELPREILGAAFDTVSRYPRFVLLASLLGFGLLASGASRVGYATDFGFGEGSLVVRSLRFIEANFRKPMTTEAVVTLLEGTPVYHPASLQLLRDVEAVFGAETSTGHAWSLLDLLEDAYLVDRGRPPDSFEELTGSARRELALVAGSEQARRFWSEAIADPARSRSRLRVSVDRAWLDDDAQSPYVARIEAAIEALDQRAREAGHRVELEGGLVLADRFVRALRDTQWRSFASAFAVVAATLALLLRGAPRLLAWALVANALPVAALLGLMGWVRIGIDPANTMVGAILLAIAVDDTIHVALRYQRERARVGSAALALQRAFETVGEAVLVTSLCLMLGFSVLLFSQWGGLVWFGLLASLGVGLVLAGDLLLLPAALLVGARNERDATR
ncbi:MAG: MMPL family transporter [Myxococcota bacterium]|nr:MMPL family transporter [Myxococcota bacterium]